MYTYVHAYIKMYLSIGTYTKYIYTPTQTFWKRKQPYATTSASYTKYMHIQNVHICVNIFICMYL